ncbi:hypothetical protein EGCR1_02670 [Enterococcus gilvus]|nr:hypothetical protein EGCR1_02670 [Enterococcus gilvus]
MFFIGFYQVPVLIKVSEKCFTNVATRRARHRVGTFFFCEFPFASLARAVELYAYENRFIFLVFGKMISLLVSQIRIQLFTNFLMYEIEEFDFIRFFFRWTEHLITFKEINTNLDRGKSL